MIKDSLHFRFGGLFSSDYLCDRFFRFLIIKHKRDLLSRFDKRNFVPRDQVFPLLVYSSLLLQRIVSSFFTLFSSIRIVLDCFYLFIFYFDKFSS